MNENCGMEKLMGEGTCEYEKEEEKESRRRKKRPKRRRRKRRKWRWRKLERKRKHYCCFIKHSLGVREEILVWRKTKHHSITRIVGRGGGEKWQVLT